LFNGKFILAGDGLFMKIKLFMTLLFIAVACNKHSIKSENIGDKINALIHKKKYHEALKQALKEKDQSKFEISKIYSIIATDGEKDWGKIFDDREIMHGHKIIQLARIINLRIGEGSIYPYNAKSYLLPLNAPLVPQVIMVTEQIIFPERWLDSPIYAAAEPLLLSEVDRFYKILEREIKKYPQKLLKENIKNIFVMDRLTFHDTYVGGSYANKTIYITNPRILGQHSDLDVESTFHHELSSVFLLYHPGYFEKKKWLGINDEKFNYGKGGLEEIRNNKASRKFDAILNSQGFLHEYALSSLENDFNSFAESIFVGDTRFWDIVDKYPKIEMKLNILIDFYSKLDPIFTKEYFLSFRESPLPK